MGVLLFLGYGAAAESGGDISIRVSPGLTIPIGNSARYYSLGGRLKAEGDYTLPFAPRLRAHAGLDYALIPAAAGTSLNLVSLEVGPGVGVALTPRMSWRSTFSAGYTVALYEGSKGGNPFIGVETGIGFDMGPSVRLDAALAYLHTFAASEPLYQGLGLSLGGAYMPGRGRKQPRLETLQVEVQPIFPVLHKFYDTNPLGSVELLNGEGGPITTVTFEESEGGTLVILREHYPTKDALDAGLASGAASGYGEMFTGLDALLAVTPV